jgi:hypothetical protein
MERQEAREVLRDELARFRTQSHEQLQRLLKTPITCERRVSSGTSYTIEIQAFWDSHPGGDIRVQGSVDDGSLRRAVRPLCDDFIMAPDGTYVGEP